MLRKLILPLVSVAVALPAAGQCEIDRLDPNAPANIHASASWSGDFAYLPVAPTSIVVFRRHPHDGWEEVLTFDSDDGGLFFGMTGASSGGTVAMSYPDGAGGVGSAFVFDRENGWLPGFPLIPADLEFADMYGQSIAVDGDTIVVGATMDNPAVGGPGPGKAYVFERGPAGWSAVARFDPHSFTQSLVRFGHACDADGATAVVGSPEDDQLGTRSGAVYVYERGVGGWGEIAKLTPSTAQPDAYFGASVSVAGERMLVGAPHAPGGGAVHVFERSAGVWVETQVLVGSDTQPDDRFGHAVEVGEGWALSSAPDFDTVTSNEGKVYAFRQSLGVWVEELSIVADQVPPNFNLGTGLSLSGNQLLAAAAGPQVRLYSLGIADAANTCSSTPNSTGAPAVISVSGCDSVLANELLLSATSLPPSSFGQFLLASDPAQAPLGNGLLCLAAPVFRGPPSRSDAVGWLEQELDLTDAFGASVRAGSTWYAQALFRDPGVGAGFDSSNAVRIVFQP